MNALVTGPGGFLGRHVVEQLLARGDHVRGFHRGQPGRYPDLERRGVELVQGDLRDPLATKAACAGIDVVFHVAGLAGIWGPWKQYFEINTLGTRHVIAGCREQRVARLVYTSTPSVTFDGRAQEGVDERAPYAKRWLSHYPKSKALAEQEVLAAAGPDLLACALRPHLIWGPGDRHLVPRLLERAARGQLRRIGDGTNRIDMVYVENAARAHLQAADALARGSACGRAYFISQGAPVNCWDWINELLAMAGLPPVRRSISLRTAWAIGAALEALHRVLAPSREPRMTRFLAAQLGLSHYFDISRARHELGYSAVVTTAEGMRRMAGALEAAGRAYPQK